MICIDNHSVMRFASMTMNITTQRIKFRHLIYFAEVARLGSVIKAADALRISQPAVSKTLRELEEELGVDLFDRSHRNVVSRCPVPCSSNMPMPASRRSIRASVW